MITDRPIDLDDRLTADAPPAAGAVVTFTGVVRGENRGRVVTGIFYDCYREMAERELARLVSEVRARFPLEEVRVVHRVGEIPVGEASLRVVVAAAHRRDAFEACGQLVDAIKRRVPIWKKERYAEGEAAWL